MTLNTPNYKPLNYNDIIEKYNIKSICVDSRYASAQSIFVAISGNNHDGNEYIEDALKSGCVAIITDSEQSYQTYKDRCPIFLASSARLALAEFAIALKPETPEHLIAVTGTNGKSSVVDFIFQILKESGKNCARLGTLGSAYWTPDISEDITDITAQNQSAQANLTTFNPIILSDILSDLAKKNVDYCAMEASSIGLEQARLHARKFKVAGFTSFSQDHLDYHHTMDEYLRAKLRLFTDHLEENGVAVINKDMDVFDKIEKELQKSEVKYVTYGSQESDYQYHIEKTSVEGQKFSIIHNKNRYELETTILGSFQVANIVLTLALLDLCGLDLSKTHKYAKSLKAPSGRLERLSNDPASKASSIFIDYAHTPDALHQVLTELGKVTKANGSRLICIFGCGGNRDTSKRPLMGHEASNLADIVIVTDDNPRDEDPTLIRAEIIASCPSSVEIGDREEAIKFGISLMKQGDILLIAGKGHEEYQIIGDKKTHFSDREVGLKLATRY